MASIFFRDLRIYPSRFSWRQIGRRYKSIRIGWSLTHDFWEEDTNWYILEIVTKPEKLTNCWKNCTEPKKSRVCHLSFTVRLPRPRNPLSISCHTIIVRYCAFAFQRDGSPKLSSCQTIILRNWSHDLRTLPTQKERAFCLIFREKVSGEVRFSDWMDWDNHIPNSRSNQYRAPVYSIRKGIDLFGNNCKYPPRTKLVYFLLFDHNCHLQLPVAGGAMTFSCQFGFRNVQCRQRNDSQS